MLVFGSIERTHEIDEPIQQVDFRENFSMVLEREDLTALYWSHIKGANWRGSVTSGNWLSEVAGVTLQQLVEAGAIQVFLQVISSFQLACPFKLLDYSTKHLCKWESATLEGAIW